MDDRILENYVNKWLKSVEVIDANRARLEKDELQAYTTIRGIFGKKRPNMEQLANSCDILKEYLNDGQKDELYTAIRDLVKASEFGKDEFQAFKEFLEDKDFFGSSTANEGTDFQGMSMGTATYRRVEIDGDIYEGMFLGNDRVWKGKINYSNGNYYEGEWGNEGPHGEGVLTSGNGTVFTGRFNGFSGSGKITFKDGDYYEGPWNEYGPNGRGVLHMANRVDSGEYTNGLRTGSGRIEWGNGNWYEGGWNEKGPNGKGVWKIGDRIDRGEYKDGARTGSGRMEWKDGDWYEGGWNENGANGEGTRKIGDRLEKGEFTDGARTGSGRIEWKDGDWYEGGWNANGKNGKGTLYVVEENCTYMGEWKDDIATGHVVMKWGDGNKYDGTWYLDGGALYGEGAYYTAYNSKTRTGKWVKGSWENDWATPRNIIGTALMVFGVIFILAGSWLLGIAFGVIGKITYEGT
jgi:hypothetical protein